MKKTRKCPAQAIVFTADAVEVQDDGLAQDHEGDQVASFLFFHLTHWCRGGGGGQK